ncbi:MAG: UDP-N-acetylmuramoyl-L-alanyl-D-glutamate--2,6-diaminopimelate ligase [Lentisphaeria bacterium]|nr:UDP-N-acetylmuramoyl-L-alanyl-D-glutamate--2,6-diaminopimelate ligase [Lentisphaeria bacterium]
MTLAELVTALGTGVTAVRGNVHADIRGATVDSRQVRKGDLFIAVSGTVANGAQFIPDALARGAAAIVADTSAPLRDCPMVIVDDAYTAAGRVAEILAGYPAREMRCLGVTGTNGKTTCAFLLQRILIASGRRCGLIGTVYYDTGDGKSEPADRTTPPPFELQRLMSDMRKNGCQDMVAEVSSHAASQRRFGGTRFAGAVFTNLTGDHLDYHRTEEAYFQAKVRLFVEGLERGGIAVVNGDDPWGKKLTRLLGRERPDLRVRTFGFNKPADDVIADYAADINGLTFKLISGQSTLSLSSPVPGRFNAENIAAVASLALTLGCAPEAIVEATRVFTGAPGRMWTVDLKNHARAVIDYAHTDDALKNVLQTLRELNPKRLTVVFGCGGDRDRSKRPRMGRVAAERADKLIVTSDNPRTEPPTLIINDICCGIHDGADYERIVDRRAAVRKALAEALPGEIVLIAGKGHEDYQEINGVRTHLDDLEEVEAFLKDCGDEGAMTTDLQE